MDTIWKLINTNRNIEGISSLVNFQGILPTGIFSRYIPRELQWEKKIKTKKFRRYFSESSGTVHFLTTLLIVVLYRRNHRRIKKSSVLFGVFFEKFQLIYNFQLNLTDEITDGLKSCRWLSVVSEFFLLN
jgi:hypothetical protein